MTGEVKSKKNKETVRFDHSVVLKKENRAKPKNRGLGVGNCVCLPRPPEENVFFLKGIDRDALLT